MRPTLSQNLSTRITPRPNRILSLKPGVGAAVSVVLFKPTMMTSRSRDAVMVNYRIILHTLLPTLKGVRSCTLSAQSISRACTAAPAELPIGTRSARSRASQGKPLARTADAAGTEQFASSP